VTAKVPRKPGAADRMPDRLADVEDWLTRYWPGIGACAEKVLAWHELRAEVFAHVAETDPRHHHEALALAGIEQRKAQALASLTGAGAGAEVDRAARPGAFHSPHEKGRGATDGTSD
jgi:hypothetical protein